MLHDCGRAVHRSTDHVRCLTAAYPLPTRCLAQSEDEFAAEHGKRPQAQLNAAPCLQAQADASVI